MSTAGFPDRIGGLELPTLAALALALFVVPLLSVSGLVEGALVGAAVKWVVVGLVLVVVVRFEGRSPTSIGLVRPTPADLGWALAVAVAGVAAFAVTDPVVEALGLSTRDGLAVPSLAVGLVVAVTAGITEEVLFRGYPIERLIGAGYGPVAAGTITWALFTVAHVGAGYPAGNLLQIAAVAAVVTAVYVRVRSLVPVVVGHVLIDVAGVLEFVFA